MIFKFIRLLLDLFKLKLYKNRISKLEKEREETKYIITDGEIEGQDF